MTNVDKVVTLINDGAPIAGAAVGGAVGFVTGGPGGAALGGALGAALAHGVEETAERVLSRREKIRVGAAASYAIDFVRDRLLAGDLPREDGFFDNFEFGTSPAAEIFDGVLSKAKGDYEERKARFYGKFFSNVAFDSSCSRSEANYFLHLLDRLTYSQLVIVSLFAGSSRFSQLPDHSYENKNMNPELSQTLLATFELSQLGLVKLWISGRDDVAEALLDLGDIRPRDMRLSLSGKRLHELAGPGLISERELDGLADTFASSERSSGTTVLTEISKLRNR